jgi:hypothetical protein
MDSLTLKQKALQSIETTHPVAERHVPEYLNVQQAAGTGAFKKYG